MFWTRSSERGTYLGLTQELLQELGVIWNYFPRVKIGQTIFQGQALATVQSTDKLKSLTSPISGRLIDMTTPERPDNITTKKVLFIIEESDALPRV